MTENEFDRTARAWLDDGPSQMSDRALLSALEEIHTTRQRRSPWPARRATPVTMFARVAVAAVFVVAVGLIAGNVVPRLPFGSSVGAQPTPSSTADPTPSPSPSSSDDMWIDFPNLKTTFVSPTYGYSFKYLDRGGLSPATEPWDPVNAAPNEAGASLIGRDVDQFDVVETGLGAMFVGASMEIADGSSIYDWIDDYISAGGCYVPRNEQAAITIDGHSGRISDECPDKVVATVVVDGRLYLFAMLHNRADARALFDAFAATIDLRPEDIAVPSSTPASS
jgi:hypothetical protein